MAGAVYVSITVEAGAENAGMSARTAGVINDTSFDVGPDGIDDVKLTDANGDPLDGEPSGIYTLDGNQVFLSDDLEETVAAARSSDPRSGLPTSCNEGWRREASMS